MIDWIKDSTILWIKNKGAGSATNEKSIKNDNELKEIKDYYEDKIKVLMNQV